MDVVIYPSEIKGSVTAPASKSYTQRAIAIATLAEGESSLENFGLCDDTCAAMGVSRNLGAELSLDNRVLSVKGGVLNVNNSQLNIGESGLSTRLFTPLASLLGYNIEICGHGSILSRPVDMMETPLRELGVKISSNNGFLPIEVCGPMRGGEITVDGGLSSQFLTGLLISLPMCGRDSVVNVESLKSKPYIDMTLEVVKAFGCDVVNENYERFIVKGNQRYMPTRYNIEGDWSGASCILVGGAISGDVVVKNLDMTSRQADKAIVDALNRAGASVEVFGDSIRVARSSEMRGFDFDATDCPDIFPALVALAAACDGESVIVGTERLTHKESDRAKTLKDLYERFGILIDISSKNLMKIKGGKIKGGVSVDSHNDHRIAMSAAVSARRAESKVTIIGSECVNKSYSDFFSDLESLAL